MSSSQPELSIGKRALQKLLSWMVDTVLQCWIAGCGCVVTPGSSDGDMIEFAY